MTLHEADGVSPGVVLVVVAAAAVAGTLGARLERRGLLVPVVVLELLLGVLVGHDVIGLHVSPTLGLLSDIGLAMLFFCAGFEIDFSRIRGAPLRLGGVGWGISLALAYGITGLLHFAGVRLPVLYTGSALATTAIGTLIPVLSDAGELDTAFGTYLLAAGATAEFGPILLMTLLLSAESKVHQLIVLLIFGLVAIVVGTAVVSSSERIIPLLRRTIDSSSQLAVRWLLVLAFGLALLAFQLNLDLLLGGFAAGVIAAQVLGEHEVPSFDAKLSAVAYGVFVPFFFVVSGMELDVSALFSSVAALVRLLVFFVLLLIVRGLPALLLYRHVLPLRSRQALALLTSTQLPLVLAISTLAVDSGHMAAAVAASLVGAAVLSTICFPMLGLRVLKSERAAAA